MMKIEIAILSRDFQANNNYSSRDLISNVFIRYKEIRSENIENISDVLICTFPQNMQ